MKNILQEKPDIEISGRLLFSTRFVDNKDIKGKTVLDIGCGYGWCEKDFLKRGIKKVIGIEVKAKVLELARKNLASPKIEFVTGNALQIPFPNQSFNTVICWEVLEHLPKNTEIKLFAEVNRVLKDGGLFYLSSPYDHFISKLLDPAWWLIGHRHYSRRQITQYIKSCGFKLSKMKIRGGLWCVGLSINRYFSKWVLKRKPLFHNYFTTKVNSDYQSQSGFYNLFAKIKKTKDSPY